MPTEIFEDGLDVQIGLLEAEPIERGPAYPFPRLRVTGLRETRRLRVIVLQNPYLRVTLAPSLGGRILSLYDRRTSREILPACELLLPLPGGRRGAFLPSGIQLRLDGEDRLNSLGNVAALVVEAEDELSTGGVWIGESSLARGLGFHLFVSLPPDRAEISLEARVSNRAFQFLPYDGELAVHVEDGTFDGRLYYSDSRDAGFHLSTAAIFDGARLEDGAVRFSRFGEPKRLAPRQADSWLVTLAPCSGLTCGAGGRTGATPEAAACFDRASVRLQVSMPRPGHKLLLLTEDGQTLEAPVDLYPEHLLEMSLADLPSPAAALVLLDARREEVLRIDPTGVAAGSPRSQNISPKSSPEIPCAERGASEPGEPGGREGPDGAKLLMFAASGPQALSPQTPEIELRRATFGVADRYLAHTALGIQALSAKKFLEGDAAFEQALLYNADDPLLWWEKALAQRLLGNEEELPELLNAHYLAPLEPALRAEAFLAQPLAMGKEPSPLLAAFAENPEDFVEVACLLIEHGQFEQAHRWLDEALRSRDLAALRLLAAYCLLMGSQMDAEAAEHVRAAAQVAGPPYPWRPIEQEALRTLHRRFPDDATIADLIAFCSPAIPSG